MCELVIAIISMLLLISIVISQWYIYGAIVEEDFTDHFSSTLIKNPNNTGPTKRFDLYNKSGDFAGLVYQCPIGTDVIGNKCLPTCGVGMVRGIDSLCHVRQCENGFMPDGSSCVPIKCGPGKGLMKNGVKGNKCVPIECPESQTIKKGVCTPKAIKCKTGTKWNNFSNSCEPIQCMPGTMLNGNNCILDSTYDYTKPRDMINRKKPRPILGKIIKR